MMQEQKTERIDIRTNTSVKAILQQAASSVNKTVSDFLLETGLSAAVGVLIDRKVFIWVMLRDDTFLFHVAIDTIEDIRELFG